MNVSLEDFSKVIDRFQGKEVSEIPQYVIDDLKIHSKDQPLSKMDVRKALKKLGFSKFYKDVHILHHVLTGVPRNVIPPQVVYNIMKDFENVIGNFKGRNFF